MTQESASLKCTWCQAGRFSAENSCVECFPGTYSGASSDACVVCEPGKISESGATLCLDCVTVRKSAPAVCLRPVLEESVEEMIIQKGSWRPTNTSTDVRDCPRGAGACLGGAEVGTASCATGSEAAMCTQCSEDYFRKMDGTCATCEGGSPIPGYTIGAMLFIGLVAVVVSKLVAAGGTASRGLDKVEGAADDAKSAHAKNEETGATARASKARELVTSKGIRLAGMPLGTSSRASKASGRLGDAGMRLFDGAKAGGANLIERTQQRFKVTLDAGQVRVSVQLSFRHHPLTPPLRL